MPSEPTMSLSGHYPTNHSSHPSRCAKLACRTSAVETLRQLKAHRSCARRRDEGPSTAYAALYLSACIHSLDARWCVSKPAPHSVPEQAGTNRGSHLASEHVDRFRI